jgi:hypothetical protein
LNSNLSVDFTFLSNLFENDTNFRRFEKPISIDLDINLKLKGKGHCANRPQLAGGFSLDQPMGWPLLGWWPFYPKIGE